jgi:hypothetical protein
MTLGSEGATADVEVMLTFSRSVDSSDRAPATTSSVRPKGPSGLWGALVSASTPSVVARELPVADAAGLGAGSSMFAYDAEQAVSLGVDLDELLLADG